MDKVERANRRAKDAIIEWLVASENPATESDAVKSLYEWESLTYDRLLVAKDYNLQHNVYPHTVLIKHMERCVRLAEEAQIEAQQKKQGRQLQEATR